uniref:Secreted protein n=1 Tax=Anguilla anguilla TaxID=7936 RepID=A0A0E9R0B6_ANGAN
MMHILLLTHLFINQFLCSNFLKPALLFRKPLSGSQFITNFPEVLNGEIAKGTFALWWTSSHIASCWTRSIWNA